MKKGVFALAD